MMGNPVRAVLFDLDGTLVNTEVHTDQAIRAVAARHGVDGFDLPADETHGRTWMQIAGTMRARTAMEASADALAQELLDHWSRAARQAQPIPGAAEAIRAAASAGLKLAIVSSSPRPVIDRFVESLGVGECIGL